MQNTSEPDLVFPTPEQMRNPIEWPTWLCLGLFWLVWLLLLFLPSYAPLGAVLTSQAGFVILFSLLVIWLAWYMSLQHELVHGHPTHSRRINRWLGLTPFSIWFPYDVYLQSHLKHHHDPDLTIPGVDPESNYVLEKDWHHFNALERTFAIARRTVLGRLLVCPAGVIAGLMLTAWRAIKGPDTAPRKIWLVHIGACILLLCAIHFWSAWNVWLYFLASYLALGLAMLRSFYEHRPANRYQARIVINEAAWFWRWLYLNNNFHAVHHKHPKLAWYLIPSEYRAHKALYLQDNEGFLLNGYTQLATQYAAKPIDNPKFIPSSTLS